MNEHFSLGRVAVTREHLLADALEISLAFGNYEQISFADALGIIGASAVSSDELLNADEPDLDDNNVSDSISDSEATEAQQSAIENAFRNIEYRIASLGNLYPYVLVAETLSLRTELTDAHRLYLLLLACSRSRSFKLRGVQQRLADCFEEVSAESLKRLLPKSGKVYMFGPNSRDRKEVFGSRLSDAIPALTQKLGMDQSPVWKAPVGASGDAKIDLVGVYDFSDTAKGYNVIIGQCASMEDPANWEKKRCEADLGYHHGIFHYLVKPSPALFIPGFYRSSDGGWIDHDKVSGVIAIDRYRILKSIFEDGDVDFPLDEKFERAGISINS